MTHLILRQTTNSIEQVDSSCINDLYRLVIDAALDNTSDICGRINTTSTTQTKINVLHTLDSQNPPVPVAAANNEGAWDNLFATATAYAIPFQDAAFEQFFVNTYNNGNELTSTDIKNFASIDFRDTGSHSDILSLDDLAIFTSATGIYGVSAEYFPNVTSITFPASCRETYSIDRWSSIQHVTCLGTMNISYARCDNLETITAYSYTSIMCSLCTKLRNITVSIVPLTTSLPWAAFSSTLLEDFDFLPEAFTMPDNTQDQFLNITTAEQLPISTINTLVPRTCYAGCSSWKGDAIFPPVTTYFKNGAFNLCSSLTSIVITAQSGISFESDGRPWDTINPYAGGAYNDGCPIYVPLSTLNAVKSDNAMTKYTESGTACHVAGTYVEAAFSGKINRIYGYRILKYTSGAWTELSDFGQGRTAMDLVKEARKNTVFYNNTTDVPSSGSEGDLAFAVYLNP